MGYGQVGKRLFNATEGVDRSAANDYWSWISEYGGPEFQGVVDGGIGSSTFLPFRDSEIKLSRRRIIGIVSRSFADLARSTGRAIEGILASDGVGNRFLGRCDEALSRRGIFVCCLED